MNSIIAKGAVVCVIACGFAGYKLNAASRCSNDDVVATVKQLVGSGGSDDPRLAKLKEVGVEAVVTLDAIRTISSSPKVAVCEGRLTRKLSLFPHRALDPQPVTDGEGARTAEMEKALGLGDPIVRDLTYKVEKTDDGNDYVTIIPPDAAGEQQGPQQQYEYDRQQRMQDQQSRDEERERAYQQERDDQQQQEWRARQERLEQEEMQRR